MCGIVGYVGSKSVVPLILEGLSRLEYRGYDSAGIAVGGDGPSLELRRAPGKLRNLEAVLRDQPLSGTWGIGHTRWATHGRPTEENAHPHRDCTGRLVVVHNGIVENYLALKQELAAEGHTFVTETDTEIIAHLIEQEIRSAASSGKTMALEDAVRRACRRLTGAYAIGVISADEPDKIVAARNGPPAVIGLGKDSLGEGEYFLASDVPGILHHTRNLYFLADGDVAVLTRDGVKLTDLHGEPVTRPVQRITWDPIQAEKSGYKHFMLKEIFEQPRAIRDTTLGRISLETGKVFLGEMKITEEDFRRATRIHIAACGTSWHAAIVGKFMIERLARVPVEVDYASEYRYRDPIPDPNAIGLLITQSGETADTLAAQREMIAKGMKTLAICNVVGAMIAREAQGTLYTHAGPEIGVASTKAFTSQLVALFLFALHLAQTRGTLSDDESRTLVESLSLLPGKVEEILRSADSVCEQLAKIYSGARDFLFLGRGIHYPIALEGALKLKEISYIHAEGYPAGEMKHGPNALIDESLPVVVLATQDETNRDSHLRYEKTLSNIQEVTARSGKVIAVAIEGDTHITQLVDHVLYVPPASELLLPVLDIIPLQLLAYHIAVRRGCDVDQPRNLAKSVTVE
ncbi:glutamine--fructose-6-phosphate transaminase (isomerizing) [Silvibacterium dinghuense]|uniref:Glutamine--fructose-6-phosphate aminotransferase [isomerizing] n=1 Tax=Silvibacterium dinghuense TaxID=1560006 RepID=A0A4Q1S8W6_9BACT|nr:glutamine--fructose-6-phosphate transaminase (isomerizing) [Silvibacterium dinghuense]RXS93422.1 glutamine--fructose-6-phosphate transaminase (isomerizing) [Silvibacterium dinghuense]GGH05667.1 glutamine--fructose-6-phosphate aminotransferase [isomerizing] [Silvibacterium dinghuense]